MSSDVARRISDHESETHAACEKITCVDTHNTPVVEVKFNERLSCEKRTRRREGEERGRDTCLDLIAIAGDCCCSGRLFTSAKSMMQDTVDDGTHAQTYGGGRGRSSDSRDRAEITGRERAPVPVLCLFLLSPLVLCFQLHSAA